MCIFVAAVQRSANTNQIAKRRIIMGSSRASKFDESIQFVVHSIVLQQLHA